MKLFHIICLPRSGSAWLSVFLSHGNAFCFHDLLADVEVGQLAWRYINRKESVVGSVETGSYITDPSPSLPPSTQYFYIHRDWKEVEESWAKLGYGVVNVKEEHDKMLAMAKNLGARRLEYSKFSSLTYLSWIWGTVVGTGFDAERAAYLIEMNITRDLQKIVHRAVEAKRL